MDPKDIINNYIESKAQNTAQNQQLVELPKTLKLNIDKAPLKITPTEIKQIVTDAANISGMTRVDMPDFIAYPLTFFAVALISKSQNNFAAGVCSFVCSGAIFAGVHGFCYTKGLTVDNYTAMALTIGICLVSVCVLGAYKVLDALTPKKQQEKIPPQF